MPRVTDVDNVAPDLPIEAPAKVGGPVSPSGTDINAKVYEIFGHTKHPFSSSLIIPKVFSFAEQDDDEIIYVALRPHWFTNVSWILIGILMLTGPFFLKFIPLIDTLPVNYLFVLTLFWYLITIAFSFEKFMSWYFDVYIITNHRVIDIDFYNLLTKKFSEADLSKIQDVTSQVSGVSQTIFNYGNVLIQTAAEINEIHFEKVPHPDRVVKIIQDLTEKGEGP
jgi:hypothetical protein